MIIVFENCIILFWKARRIKKTWKIILVLVFLCSEKHKEHNKYQVHRVRTVFRKHQNCVHWVFKTGTKHILKFHGLETRKRTESFGFWNVRKSKKSTFQACKIQSKLAPKWHHKELSLFSGGSYWMNSQNSLRTWLLQLWLEVLRVPVRWGRKWQ